MSVYGYPIGGEQLSVTQGIVSRIEYASFYYLVGGVRIQVDAAINPGNSGGPAIADGKIVGLVFGKITKAENIGYLIAAEEIQMFLKDIASGGYRGKPRIWDLLESTENEALRSRLGLGAETGMMVYQPFRTTPDYPLKKWDVVTRIGGQALDNKGDVKVKDDLKLSYQYFVPKLAKDGRIAVSVFRDRKTREVNLPVRTDGDLVVPFLMDKYPRYFVCGPMVFMQATQELGYLLASASGPYLLTMLKNPLLSRQMDHARVRRRGNRHVGLWTVAP